MNKYIEVISEKVKLLLRVDQIAAIKVHGKSCVVYLNGVDKSHSLDHSYEEVVAAIGKSLDVFDQNDYVNSIYKDVPPRTDRTNYY